MSDNLPKNVTSKSALLPYEKPVLNIIELKIKELVASYCILPHSTPACEIHGVPRATTHHF